MAPIKFEENIKEKLDKRTIKPSADAWDRLSKRLESREEKRSNKTFWWLGIAASIIGVLLVGSQFFKSKPIDQITPKIVVTPEVVKQDDNTKIVTENIEELKRAKEETKFNEEKKTSQIKNEAIIIQQNLIKENIAIAKEKDTPKLKNKPLQSEEKIANNLTFEDQKVKDLVAQIKKLKDSNLVVNDQVIDALLAEAQKEITLEQLYNDSTGIVDANLLLQDVEEELDQSFRNKVLEALKSSYNSVKTAVAQRND
ncbi:hypothetical protein BFR04_15655 [Gaetbulibacter sp. 4G1]|nr:hypothetical protein [Gaetbulibacter sp. 4G1]PIA81131.1 hypothetical protein BFR04_15655 [Gaetbulibacter sp. 4G1]